MLIYAGNTAMQQQSLRQVALEEGLYADLQIAC